MTTFLIVAAIIMFLLGLGSYIAEKRIGHAPDRTTPGYALLPGDIKVERGNFRFYFPITTSIVLSIIVTLIIRFIS